MDNGKVWIEGMTGDARAASRAVRPGGETGPAGLRHGRATVLPRLQRVRSGI
jgi:hypothetical protein